MFVPPGRRIPAAVHSLQLENARADAKFWDALGSSSEARAALSRELAAEAERAAEAAKDASERASVAQERVEALERGEAVSGGLGKPLDHRKVFREAGWSDADMRRAARLSQLDDAGVRVHRERQRQTKE